MKFKKLIAGVLLASMAFTASCGGAGTTDGATTGDGATNATDTIVIGEIGPITGEGAIYGVSTYEGAALAIEQFGDINGKKVIVKQYDDQMNPPEAINAYNRLTDNDNVTAILGAITSGATSAVVEASQAKGTAIVTPTATLDSITTLGTNVYRGCFQDSYQGQVMAKFAYENLGAKKAAIIYNNSSDYSNGLEAAFTETFTSLGGEIVASEAYSDSDVNFKVQLAKIQEAKPEVLFAPDYYEKIALLTKQVNDMGLDVKMLGSDGWDGVLDLVSDPAILNNSYICNSFSTEDQSESVQKFIADYTEKFGKAPNGFAASGYDAALVLLTAIKNCDTNGDLSNEAIIAELAKTEVAGVNGNIKFDENRNAIKGAVIIEYKDGKGVINTKIEG